MELKHWVKQARLHAGMTGERLGDAVGRSKANVTARYAIEQCWKQQERKSLDPGTARFVAGACEQMEADFRRKYGLNP